MRYILFSFLFFGSIFNIYGQESDNSLLDFYGDAMMNSYQEKNRQYAFDQFYPLLKKHLESIPVIVEEKITGVNIIQPDDGEFQLYSWQLELEKKVKYYAFLKSENGKVYEFLDNNDDLGVDFSYYLHSTEDWYGAVYYKLRAERNDRKNQYIITGFKKVDEYTKAKIVDVLTFNEEGVPSFGKEIFHKAVKGSRDDISTKLLITYDANAFADFAYDDNTKRIIYDHLISKMGSKPGQGMTKYPDGTYEGYDNKSGVYHYVEKMFHEVSKTPPSDNKKRVKSGLFRENK